MRCEVITVGTEILLGDTVNTNAAWISRRLAQYGVNLFQQRTVGDNHGRLVALLQESMRENDIIVTTGGLGPTQDDITRECVAEALGVPLVLDEFSLKRIQSFFELRGRTMTENNRRQAMIPRGGTALLNDAGTAPGCLITVGTTTVIMLPGPPHEMKHVFTEHIDPFLSRRTDTMLVSRTLRIAGIGESDMENRVAEIIRDSVNPTVAPYAKPGECSLRITARASTHDEARNLIAPLERELVARLDPHVYGFDDDTLESCCVRLLAERGYTIACAESCTGGMFASRLVSVPGVSDVFLCSIVSYANKIKVSELGVSPETLAAYGAVSQETALEMARGVRTRYGADVTVGITGIAGPDGGTPEKPVGLVYYALIVRGTESVYRMVLPGDRDAVRMRTVNIVFHQLISLLK